ncbi:chaperonin 10-like protein [Aspergillus pseudocaelatus]|uniref:Chaperonin 10-like protein n=1 Tax=Aspergillus pseudocaelatus TaxID=1825620 RepID=A0ABQ6WVR2_9EURO|nr:chaperonin 10-like protein [Aspergillus pseudocaelatus]
MITTTAIVAREPEQPLSINWALEEVEVYTPGEGEILVEMRATGICHTDIVLSSVPSGSIGIQYPKILGHEGAGIVRARGQNVKSVEVGDPVLLSYYSCSSCESCQNSHPAYCDVFAKENYVGRQGGMKICKAGEEPWSMYFGQSSFARHSIVSEVSVVNVKNMLRSEDELKLFAPLGCGFQTGMGAILNTSNAGPDDVVMILGLGAVGMGALMTAKIRECKAIIVVDKVETRLEHAKRLGASHTINTGTLDNTGLKDAVCQLFPSGASVVIDTTGVPALIEEGLQATRKRGKLVLIGVAPLGYGLNVDVVQHVNFSALTIFIFQ